MTEDKDYYLKLVSDNKDLTVAIIGNKKGLESLKDCIDSLLQYQGPLPEDVNLVVPSWGGEGLTEDNDPLPNGCTKVEQLRVYIRE